MKLILITPEIFHKDENSILEKALEIGVDRIHVRKPNCNHNTLYKYIDNLSDGIIRKSSLHYYKDIFMEFNFSGFHFSVTQKEYFPNVEKKNSKISTSFHSMGEVLGFKNNFDYAFCSPVFPSISKQDHEPDFEWNIKGKQTGIELYALGGIDHSKIERCKERGFDGVGILGAVWNKNTIGESIEELIKIKRICEEMY